jgi:hypothetical protein
MKKYKILKMTWNDLEHTEALLELEVFEDGKAPYTMPFGLKKDDESETSKAVWKMLEMGEIEIVPLENKIRQMLSGIISVPQGYRIIEKDGVREVVNDVDEKARMALKVRERLDRYYSGYELAMAERHPKRAENRKRKIDALLAADTLPDYPYIDLEQIEREA